MNERAVPSGFGSCRLKLLWCGMIFAGFVICAGAIAAERHAYRYVDENGRVVYSEYPPSPGTDWKAVDTTTAITGRSTATPRPKYGEESRYSSQRQDQGAGKKQGQDKKAAEARQKRFAAAKAECSRNGGAGCEKPVAPKPAGSGTLPGSR